MEAQQKVYEKLTAMGIKYEVINHPAVYTIEEMENLGITDKVEVCKNLFVRDAKGKKHYLIILRNDKRADLSNIAAQIGSTKLSFASEERLERYLRLKKGAVSPLGIINDAAHEVEVVFDKDLVGKANLGVHPNDNTATVVLSYEDLKRVVFENGNEITFVNI
ncbi:prolyl-tRNA synthetase associated domain-containing protein [Lutispora saccharofermentans]|uniref:Prolyl-tRNA synthetase associated domain-containing protein n=1 Tax=Lutispora saccharofermentans TaxID=3024236 RepID=A0ABT1NG10_9FIRM|nr:prolyl-tRNA synthetase associated domain-containing protein [Lutispora saccharofermentans]MCQ1530173.1 prolyl-tRNA synthetase associated domain-containing protein [Lutispora saccharofermentans]